MAASGAGKDRGERAGDAESAPRKAGVLVGQARAERTLRRAWDSGRLAHAWLLHGPRGIGKATLAYRFARFVLAHGAGPGLVEAQDDGATLAVDPDDPVARRVAAGAHADLATVERSWDEKRKRLRNEIVVADVRALSSFFAMTPAEGGWRVAVVDAADEMNRHAANAVLKILEEPPRRGLLLLVSHAPGRLLPTIRSRCRRLALDPLAAGDIAALLAARAPDIGEGDRKLLAAVAEGSFGRALGIAEHGGVELVGELIEALSPLPDLDQARLHELGDRLARRGADGGFEVFAELLLWWLARFVRHMARHETTPPLVAGEEELARRLAERGGLEQWVDVWEKVARFLARAEAMNLDRKQVVLIVFHALSETARGRSPTLPD